MEPIFPFLIGKVYDILKRGRKLLFQRQTKFIGILDAQTLKLLIFFLYIIKLYFENILQKASSRIWYVNIK